jgi:hypothetical protein
MLASWLEGKWSGMVSEHPEAGMDLDSTCIAAMIIQKFTHVPQILRIEDEQGLVDLRRILVL